MYYAFIKDLNMVLMILTVFVSVIIISLTAIYNANNGTDLTKVDSLIDTLTIHQLLQNVDSVQYQKYAIDIYVAINIAGICYLMIHSTFIIRKLVKMKYDLDKDKEAPSSYALLMR